MEAAVNYELVGGAIAAVLFGIASNWQRLKGARKKPSRTGSMAGLLRGIHAANVVLAETSRALSASGLQPQRLILLVAHNGDIAKKTMRSVIKVRAIAEDPHGVRPVLDDWLQPRPMVGDYITLLYDMVAASGRAIVCDPQVLRDRYPTLLRMYSTDGLTSSIVVFVCERDGGVYYVSAAYRDLHEPEDRHIITGALETAARRIETIVRGDLLRTHDPESDPG